MESDNNQDKPFTGASGFVITDADRQDVVFSDIRIIGKSELNYVATGIRYGKRFIIKGLNEELRNDEGCLAMLRKEFEIIIGVNHSGIRKALSFENTTELGPHIVMDFVEGKSLREWLEEKHDLKDRLRIARQIGETLKHLHSKGIVHRDIKPDNIIITRIGENAVLIDFGLADTDEYVILKHPSGTAGYASPEQKESAKPDPRNDLYSYGKVLEELLPEKKFRSLARNCQKEIDQRPQHADEVIKALNETASGRRWIIMAVIFIFAVCGVTAGIWLYNYSKKDDNTAVAVKHPLTQGVTDTNISDTSDIYPEVEKGEISIGEPIERNLPGQEITDETRPQTHVPSPTGKATFKDCKADLYNLGAKSIDIAWDDSAVSYLNSIKDPSRLRTSWDLDTIRMVKVSFLEALEYSLENSDDYIRKYGRIEMTQNDWNELDRMLESHIQDLYRKWKQRSKTMKSKL